MVLWIDERVTVLLKIRFQTTDYRQVLSGKSPLNIVIVAANMVTTVGYIIYGGFLDDDSYGAPDKAAHGRKTIMSAAIGFQLCPSFCCVG